MIHWECVECEYRLDAAERPLRCPLCDALAENISEIHPVEMDITDKLLLNALQECVPLADRPFEILGNSLGLSEDETIKRIGRMKAAAIRQISAIFDSRSLGYRSTLVAFEFSSEAIERGAAVVSRHPGVSHNYRRNHRFNLWFTLTLPGTESLEMVVEQLKLESGASCSIVLPTLRLYKIGVKLDATGEKSAIRKEKGSVVHGLKDALLISPLEKTAVRVLQRDLPLVERPFQQLLQKHGEGLVQEELFAIAKGFIDRGIMRRFSAVLRHRTAGYPANAMGVWVVPEDRIEEIGCQIAEFAAVSHCYQRPSYPPDWPYNLFSMVHGHSVEECNSILETIAAQTGLTNYARLYSTKEYKKVRVKYFTW